MEMSHAAFCKNTGGRGLDRGKTEACQDQKNSLGTSRSFDSHWGSTYPDTHLLICERLVIRILVLTSGWGIHIKGDER